jgi:hypothetical protein
MNPNDLIAQQQAIINQAIQNQQGWFWGMIALQIGFLAITGFIIYMFYARLRDIAEELMKLRVAYEFANPPKTGKTRPEPSAESPTNPFKTGGDTATNQNNPFAP